MPWCLPPGAGVAPLFLDFFNFAVCSGDLFKVCIDRDWRMRGLGLCCSNGIIGQFLMIIQSSSQLWTATFIITLDTDQLKFHLDASFPHHYKPSSQADMNGNIEYLQHRSCSSHYLVTIINGSTVQINSHWDYDSRGTSEGAGFLLHSSSCLVK